MNHNQTTEWCIGRAKTVLVFGKDSDAQAVISTVVAQICDDEPEDRIRFKGPVKFSSKTIKHITEIILPLVDQILSTMSQSQKNVQVSMVNLDVSSTMDTGSNISGYSADVPIFLAMLSVGLRILIPNHIISSGHLASSGGDIRMVMGLPDKLAAATMDDSIHTFIHPVLDQDNSLHSLSPETKQKIEDALIQAKLKLKTIPICNISDLVRVVYNDEQIILASLKQGFYNICSNDEKLIGHDVARFFIENNEKRFWNVLESNLLASQINKAKELLQVFSQFHIHQKLYPKQFGQCLNNLIQSLPPEIRRLKINPPLLPTSEIIPLSQFAQEADHEDVRLLFKSAHMEKVPEWTNDYEIIQVNSEANDEREDGKLKAILSEINPDNLTKRFGTPIDTARATYIMDSVTINSYEDFNDAVTSFYIHLMRHIGRISDPITLDAAKSEASKLLEQTFIKRGGDEAALAEARYANNGGMRFIFDEMTEQFKREQKRMHVNYVLRFAIDSSDWQAKENLLKALLKHLNPHLPMEITSQPAERYAEHYKEIVEAYIVSIEQVKSIFRSL
ncbi:MAG: hypothetical protein HF978_06345 [Desulfobacteraceae bacterium]|nr:hypothetical protein [Desulfobacteraceae bacterium]MBC2755150.1 hypothetical protein [Desulfobacteraceae bacterium]